MKLKLLIASLIALAFLHTSSSCTKTVTTYDLTTIIRKDTTIIHDTTYRLDTTRVLQGPKNPIIGLWAGTFFIDANPGFGNFYYALSIFQDHTLVARSGAPNGVSWTASGTWTLAADSTLSVDIEATDPTEGGVKEHITAKYSAANGTLNGKYAYTNLTLETGTFTLKRVGDR